MSVKKISLKDFKAFDKAFANDEALRANDRRNDNREFKNSQAAGAFLTHDILGDRKALTARKKLVMAYGFGGDKPLAYSLEELNKMAKATEKIRGKHDDKTKGIPITAALQGGGKWGEHDRRSAKAISAATLYKFTNNIIDFRVTSSGETPKAPAYYKTRVRLEGWAAAVSRVKAKNYLSAAQQATNGYVSFDCNCGRYIYFYQYLATIGNFDIEPGETVFPKIRNNKLKGICCKHILKVLMTLQSPSLQGRIAQQMQIGATDKNYEKTGKEAETFVTVEDLEEMAKAGKVSRSSLNAFKQMKKNIQAFQETLKKPAVKKAQAELKQKKGDNVMQAKLEAEAAGRKLAESAARKLKSDLKLSRMNSYLIGKVYRDKLTKEQAVADYAKDSGISLAEAQEMAKSINT